MPSYKLYYGKGKGLGELSRYLFAIKQQAYEDIRFGDDLKWEDHKASAPYGKMPFLEVDGQRFGQSACIARFLANQFGLAGKTDLEKLKADGIIDCIHKDILSKFMSLYMEKDEERKANIKKDLITNTAEMYKKLEEQAEGDNTFLKSGLSWADVCFFNFHCDFYGDRFDKIDLAQTPKLKKIIDNVAANQHIKNWIAKRPESEF